MSDGDGGPDYPFLNVQGHKKIHTEEMGLVAIEVNITVESGPDRGAQGHSLYFHPTDGSASTWMLVNHVLDGPPRMESIDRGTPILFDSNGYDELRDVYETAVEWMELEGFEVQHADQDGREG